MDKLIKQMGEAAIKISKENDLDLTETISLLEQTGTYVLDTLVCQSVNCKPGVKYVLKFEGYLEKYSSNKIAYSLERASDSAGRRAYMNASDIALVVKDVERNIGDRTVIRSKELRQWVKDALDKNGFSFVRESYAG